MDTNLNSIMDIQFVGGTVIEVKKNVFHISKVLDKVRGIRYQGQGLTRDVTVENSQLPSIAKVFYHALYNQTFLTPEALFSSYFSTHFLKISNDYCQMVNSTKCFMTEGIRGRVMRAYPSLLRDFHFYLLCSNSTRFEKVNYSFVADTKKGIDLQITYKGYEFAVSLFVNTKRSLEWKDKKYGRHDYSKVKEITLEIDPFDLKNRVGDFALYQEHHLDILVQKMEELLESVVE